MVRKLFDMDARYSSGRCFEGFRILRAVGEGRYGICYLVTDDKRLYILKQLKKGIQGTDPPLPHYEVEILKALKHEAIPGFVRRLETGRLNGYIIEYKQGITLEAMIFNRGHIFSADEIYNTGKQLINIMDYLHKKGIVHMDIRIPNVLLDGGRVYLVDFGSARWIDNGRYKADMDFSYFGDLLLHLYYTTFTDKPRKSRPWYEELALSPKELCFLKRLMGIEERYKDLSELAADFEGMFKVLVPD